MRQTQLILLSLCILAALGGTAVGLTDNGRTESVPLPSSEFATSLSPSFPPLTKEIPGLSIGTYGGIEYGTANEFVYFSGGGYDYYKVSELDWPLQPSSFLGLRFAYRSTSNLFLRVDLRGAIRSNVGYVQDSDYLNGDGLRTNYSRHTGLLLGAFTARADVGVQIVLPARITLIPFARFAFRDLKWSAQDGYLQYPPQKYPPYTYWSPTEPKVYLSGQVATYEQRYLIPALGIEGEINSGGILSLGVGLAFSPFAWIGDIDHHFLKDLIYYDSMSLCTYVEPNLHITLRPLRAVTVSLGLSYFSVTSGRDGLIITEDTLTGTMTSFAGSSSTSGASIETISATFEVNVEPQ